MDEETAIINSNTRNEKIRNFFVNNKKSLLIFFIIIVGILIGYFAYAEYKENKKIEISVWLLCLLIIGFWLTGYLTQYQRPAKIEYVEVIKEVIVTDTIYVDKIIEEKIYVPKYITQIQKDTIKVEVMNEVFVDRPIEVLKTVYVDKFVDKVIEVPPTPTGKLFLGFGYQYDLENYFSGANIKLLHKTPKDKMFSLDLGFRNDLLNKETGVGELRPYVGGTIYFRIDNK